MIEEKIISRTALKKILDDLKEKGKRIVFTNGCFDILHYGHVKYLEDARRQGDVLVVGLNSDKSVKKIKGQNRPIVNQNDRSRILAALESVDFVVIFDGETPSEIIKYLLPNILVKGGDWDKKEIVGSDVLNKTGGKVIVIPFVEGKSTSNIIDKIKNAV